MKPFCDLEDRDTEENMKETLHLFKIGGAILEDESADALLPIVDQLLIVARSGVTSPAAIDDAVKALEPARDRLLGIVLNRSGKPVV